MTLSPAVASTVVTAPSAAVKVTRGMAVSWVWGGVGLR
jgi:hypothetical protein